MMSDRQLFRNIRKLAKSKHSDQVPTSESPAKQTIENTATESPRVVDIQIKMHQLMSKSSSKQRKKRLSSATARRIDPIFLPGQNTITHHEEEASKIKRPRPMSSKPTIGSSNALKLQATLNELIPFRPEQFRQKRGAQKGFQR